MNERLREIRASIGLSQREFSEEINIGQSTLAMLENGQRNLKDIHISQICNTFNVSEEWLRTGEGEMFIKADTFSLDDYAKKNNLTELEFDIIRGYMDLDSDTRQNLMNYFKSIFNKHSEVAVAKDKVVQNDEDDIEKELEAYRLELEAEKKARILSVSEDIEEKSIG